MSVYLDRPLWLEGRGMGGGGGGLLCQESIGRLCRGDCYYCNQPHTDLKVDIACQVHAFRFSMCMSWPTSSIQSGEEVQVQDELAVSRPGRPAWTLQQVGK